MHETITVIAKYFVALPVLALGLLFLRLDRKNRLDLFLLLAASAVVTTLLVKLATSVHSDPRPFVRDGVKPYFASSTDNGFPSDHTAFSALVAFVALKYSRKLGMALAVLSLLIGSARVISGVHHGQDIIGGFLIAGVGVGLSLLLLRAIQRRQQPKQAP